MQPSYLQTKQWADFKGGFGWKADNVGGVYILSRQLPYINQTMMYVPEVMINDSNLLEKLVLFAKEKKPMFVRVEVLNKVDDQNAQQIIQKLKENDFVKAFEELQPEHRQIIDLTQSMDEILQNMKEKGRYNTRLAQKKGVRVEIIKDNDPQAHDKLKVVFDLYQKTTDRKSISGRNLVYFEKLLENFKEEIAIAVAYFDTTALAGSLTVLHDGVASYLYGGSSALHRELMAPYLLHLEVMKYAKANGCKTYDLLAIAPPDQPNHKFANLTRFKQQFGGKRVALIGSYDLILKSIWYNIFNMLENIRRK